MRTEHVTLRQLGEGGRAVVALREPTGRDEMAIEGVDTGCAVALLGRLLDQEAPEPGRMAAADRDALLAAVHRQCWGDRVVSTLTCTACGSRFDLSFQLSEVQRHLGPGSGQTTPPGGRVPGSIRPLPPSGNSWHSSRGSR